jgi:hypothetical protein
MKLVIRNLRILMKFGAGESTLKVVGRINFLTYWSITVPFPDVVDFFNLPNPSSRTMALGSTQPLTEMSTRNFPGGIKSDRRVGLTT